MDRDIYSKILSKMREVGNKITDIDSKIKFVKKEGLAVTDETGHINIGKDGDYFPVIASTTSSQPVIKFRYQANSLDVWLAAGDVGETFDLMVLYIKQ